MCNWILELGFVEVLHFVHSPGGYTPTNSDSSINRRRRRRMKKMEKGSGDDGGLDGFSTVSPTRIFWNSRKRNANGRMVEKPIQEIPETPDKQREEYAMVKENPQELSTAPVLSERRKALFEPLEPTTDLNFFRRPSAEMLLPPPDFDPTSYPRGWLIGKKRKLVNVDVVESMRRIAVQEMNRKDREIDGLNEQLEEDAKVLEHLQVQLLDERSKRADTERENKMLQSQISMLMNMLQEPEEEVEEAEGEEHKGTEDS